MSDVLDQLADKIAGKLADFAPPPPPPVEAQRLTTQQLAKLLGVHAQTVRGWVRRGCPCLMVGNRPRFRVAETEAWLVAQGVK